MKKPVTIKIVYEGSVKNITKKESEEVKVSEGLDFLHFLSFLFSSYPDIEKIFPPGTIGFLLNNKPPKTRDILADGNVVKITGMKP